MNAVIRYIPAVIKQACTHLPIYSMPDYNRLNVQNLCTLNQLGIMRPNKDASSEPRTDTMQLWIKVPARDSIGISLCGHCFLYM